MFAAGDAPNVPAIWNLCQLAVGVNDCAAISVPAPSCILSRTRAGFTDAIVLLMNAATSGSVMSTVGSAAIWKVAGYISVYSTTTDPVTLRYASMMDSGSPLFVSMIIAVLSENR